MGKTKCVLCGKTVAADGWMGSWSIAHKTIRTSKLKDIPAYYDLFPAAPYEAYTRGFADICDDCVVKALNLFGFTSSLSPCSDYDMEYSRKFAEAKLGSVESNASYMEGRESKAFFEYAVKMPPKIKEYRKNILGKFADIENDLLFSSCDYEEKCKHNIEKIKKSCSWAESSGYTFGVDDGVLKYTNYSQESLRIENELFDKTVKSLMKEMQSQMTLNSPKVTAIKKHYNSKPLFESISIEKIKHFKIIGSIGYSSEVYGGEIRGGGVNVPNAVLGGLLFGGIGAIIGAQLGTEIYSNSIKTKVTRHDDRNVEFFYENEDGQMVSKIFDASAYECLMNLIPEKAFDSVVIESKEKTEPVVNTKTTTSSLTDQLKELKELLELEIITQEEFDVKKKQLLGL